ncbi:MAG: hypothetical protein JSS07_12140 [Proteobacteria bacterium]|nr:hypothetical protein [Pseudomonadota bacterium]
MALFIRSSLLFNKPNIMAKKSPPLSLIYLLFIALLFCFISTALFAQNSFQTHALLVKQHNSNQDFCFNISATGGVSKR